MSILKIDDNDILWKYYKKAYEVHGEEVKAPSNFCEYFWCGLYGMLGVFYSLTAVWTMWLVTLSCLALSVFGLYLLGDVSNPILVWPAIIFFLLSIAANFGALASSFCRLKIPEKVIGYISGIGLMAAVGCCLILCYQLCLAVGVSAFACWSAVKLLLLIIGSLVGLAVVVISVGVLGVYVLHPMSTWRFFQAIWTYIRALKAKACPLIELPESFIVEQTKKQAKSKE